MASSVETLFLAGVSLEQIEKLRDYLKHFREGMNEVYSSEGEDGFGSHYSEVLQQLTSIESSLGDAERRHRDTMHLIGKGMKDENSILILTAGQKELNGMSEKLAVLVARPRALWRRPKNRSSCLT